MDHMSITALGIALALVLSGCGTKASEAANPATDGEKAEDSKPVADPLATPKDSLAHQFELLKEQKVDELRACFTDRQKERITAKAVADAQEDVGDMTMDELWASGSEGEYEGRKTMTVEMKNGRTLTTLVLTDGKWLADTIWFR